MGLFQELSGQGRVVGGHLSGGTVLSGAASPFSKNNDLSIQHASNPFKRHKINAETVSNWEELDTTEGVTGSMSRAAARAALPGKAGKALGAGLGAAMTSGHTVRIAWVDDKQSIVQLPEKQFMVFSVLLKDRQIATESPSEPEAHAPTAQPGVTEKLADLALSVFSTDKQTAPTEDTNSGPDVADQIAKLAALHAQGILTDEEFSDKKAELLKRL